MKCPQVLPHFMPRHIYRHEYRLCQFNIRYRCPFQNIQFSMNSNSSKKIITRISDTFSLKNIKTTFELTYSYLESKNIKADKLTLRNDSFFSHLLALYYFATINR